MRGVDNEPFWLAELAGKVRKNVVEDAQPAPANKPVIQGLMRPVLPWRISPAKTVLDHKNDPAHNAMIVSTLLGIHLYNLEAKSQLR